MVIQEPQPRLESQKIKSGLYFNFQDLEPWLDVDVASSVLGIFGILRFRGCKMSKFSSGCASGRRGLAPQGRRGQGGVQKCYKY